MQQSYTLKLKTVIKTNCPSFSMKTLVVNPEKNKFIILTSFRPKVSEKFKDLKLLVTVTGNLRI